MEPISDSRVLPDRHGSAPQNGTALGTVRICDFTGQLAGAGATKWLAAFGADVIRIEDPVKQGMWDVLRNMAPFPDDRRGPDSAVASITTTSRSEGSHST